MPYYPVNLDINGRSCLVVGGGAVATRKVKALLDCGARVTVVSLEFTEALREMGRLKQVALIERTYAQKDLDGRFLVIGATSDETLNRRISADAASKNMLCNIADVPAICNFILPSVIRRGDLVIAVSTSGKSPAFAKMLRAGLEEQFGEEYALFLTLMGAIRKKLLSTEHAPEFHKPLFERLIDSGLLDMVKHRRTGEINRLFAEVLGSGYDYETLLSGTGQQTP